MKDDWHAAGWTVTLCLIKPPIEITSFNPLAFDMKARKTDNIRAIATAAILNPSPRFIKTVLPQKSGEFEFTCLTLISAIHVCVLIRLLPTLAIPIIPPADPFDLRNDERSSTHQIVARSFWFPELIVPRPIWGRLIREHTCI